MARFQFGLEQVLRYREQLEDQARQALSQSVAAHQASLDRERENGERLAEVEKVLFNGTEACALSTADRWLYANYHAGLKNDAHVLAAQTKACEVAVAERREKLVQCAKDRQLLDKIKQKQRERHIHEEKLREQRDIDAITTTRRQVSAFQAVSHPGVGRGSEAPSRHVIFP